MLKALRNNILTFVLNVFYLCSKTAFAMKGTGTKSDININAFVLLLALMLVTTIPVTTSCNKRVGVKPGNEVKHNAKRKCKCSKKTTRWRPQSSMQKAVPAHLSESTQTNNKIT